MLLINIYLVGEKDSIKVLNNKYKTDNGTAFPLYFTEWKRGTII